MNQKTFTHLKSVKNGRVFMRTDILAERDDMIACDAQGNIAEGHIAESGERGVKRRKTAYLGNVTNGVLYPYTDILAERDDMVSIDSPEQWEAMRKTGEAPEQAPDTVAPVLGRTKEASVAPTAVEPVEAEAPEPEAEVAPGIALPSIEGLNARDAKTTLSEWAEQHFGQKLDRRPALDVVIEEAKALAESNLKAAS